MALSSSPPIVASDRFVLQRKLGEGGMGVVYEAFDRSREIVVAAKFLRTMNGTSLLRFKNEFRLLRDLRHRNLVELSELFVSDDASFFTMELVRGRSFLRWVRGRESSVFGGSDEWSSGDEGDGSGDAVAAACGEGAGRGFSEPRLRDALAQLVEGVSFLHAAQRIHRDIKPSNVLVEESGRLVVLDFGVVTYADGRRENPRQVIGTPYYMAPEQAMLGEVGPAADWYSVGVMLYEALTGTLPFVGKPTRVLEQKRQGRPIAPRELADGVPDDLNDLCLELLQPAASHRPAAAALWARLGRHPAQRAPSEPNGAGGGFVGRAEELARLREAHARSRTDCTIVVIEGESGIGKSTILARFVDDVRRERDDVLVFEARCCERETVPYKAIDGIIDDLSRHLAAETPRQSDALDAGAAQALARVFPVFRRGASAAAEEGDGATRTGDPQELRARAFAAVRALLVRVARERAVILAVEDLQWADPDGLALLRDVLHPTGAPNLLFVGTTRPLPSDAPAAQAIVSLPMRVERLCLGGLAAGDARALARQLLVDDVDDGARDEIARTIAQETGGHPLFIAELVREESAQLRGSSTPLDDAIAQRIARLDDDARDVLRVVAVAGAPIARAVVAAATAQRPQTLAGIFAALAAANLMRAHGEVVESFHDRIRETVAAQLEPAARAAYNRRLAVALEACAPDDHEALSIHWRGAGEEGKAARHALVAGAHAEATLAFHRAARAYRAALAIGAADLPSDELRLKLAEALANAGRGSEAGRAFLEAAEGRDSLQSLVLRARAADQLLRAGCIDEGVRVLRQVLAEVGLAWPRTPRAALSSLLRGRVAMRWRGFRFAERAVGEIDARALLRVDACLCAATGLGIVDTIRGSDFQTRHLRLALDAGEPARIALALGLEASFSAAGGGRTRKRTARALAEAERLSARIGDPFITGRLLGNAGIAAFLEGRWRRAFDDCERAEAIFQEKLTGVSWERSMVQLFMLNSLAYLGEVKQLTRSAAGYLRDAEQRGDLFAETNLSTGHVALAALADDDPDGARRRSAEAMARWSREGWHLEHYYNLLAQCEADLYSGDARAAYQRICRHWLDMRRSLLLRVQLIRINMLGLRMRAALALSVEDGEAARAAEAARDARAIRRERMSWAWPAAELALAALAARQPRRSADAHQLLLVAEEGFAQASMQLHGAAARWRRGQLVGGAPGAELVRTAEETMRALGVRRPDRFVALQAPGFAAAPRDAAKR